MATTDKHKSNPTSSLRGDIPAEVMAKLQAAYQAAESSSTQGCPDPETVIIYALEELIPEKRAQVYAHLSECKDCLDLVLDLRSAWAEAQGRKHKVRESTPIRVQAQSWLAGLVDGVSGLLSRLVPVPRLIPVAAALVVLVVVGVGVFQHLTAPTSGQPPFTMTDLKPGATYDYRVCLLDRADNVPSGALIKARTNLSFLPLLLEN
jgi:hypothetical protein